jgi:hypothetical protein
MVAVDLLLLSLLAGPVLRVADTVPHFDITASCGTADKSASGIGRPVQACRDDEAKARAALEARWSEFPARTRQTCTESVSAGGPPSYVELITCLEMAKP